MPNASKTEINEIDDSYSPLPPSKGLYMWGGICVQGPVNDPSTLIKSWPEFQKMFGSYHPTSDFPLLCKIALEGGCQLRINRIGHYTTITDKTTLTVTKATTTAFANSTPVNLFTITLKYPGAAYNGDTIAVEAATNGQANYFNLRYTHGAYVELYENLILPNPGVTALNSTYLDAVVKGSFFLDVTYADTSAIVVQTRPVNASKTFASGSDGGAIVAADYSGDSGAKTGIYAFDAYDDCSDLAFPDVSATAVLTAVSGYVTNRKDMMGVGHLANTNDAASELITDRDATSINSSYMYLVGGGDKVIDPVTSTNRNISEVARVFCNLAKADSYDGPPQAFTGKNRGASGGSVGVVNNFGGPGNFADLNLLANRQINMLIQEKGLIYLKGNFTAQLTNSKLSWASIRRFLIYLRKEIYDIVDIFQDEPNHFVTWRKIYNRVQPKLDAHKDTYLSIYDWRWLGDQDIKKESEMSINNATDVDNGKYKAKLYIKPVGTINWIVVDVIVTATSVSFENETIVESI